MCVMFDFYSILHTNQSITTLFFCIKITCIQQILSAGFGTILFLKNVEVVQTPANKEEMN